MFTLSFWVTYVISLTSALYFFVCIWVTSTGRTLYSISCWPECNKLCASLLENSFIFEGQFCQIQNSWWTILFLRHFKYATTLSSGFHDLNDKSFVNLSLCARGMSPCHFQDCLFSWAFDSFALLCLAVNIF